MLEVYVSRIIADLKKNVRKYKNLNHKDLFQYSYFIINSFTDNLTAEDIFYIEDLCCIYKNGFTKDELVRRKQVVDKLLQIPQVPQRSKEWFKFRKNRITASQISVVVGLGGYGTKNKIIKDKCGYSEPYKSNKYTEHGVKYEEVVTRIYSDRYNVEVHEFGCIPHKQYPFLGASPDGITSKGVALEIKCPYSRKIKDYVPLYYWSQMQLQLEVLDLPECHFIEADINEYSNFDDFYNDIYEDSDESITSQNLEKGMLIKKSITSETNQYYYIDYNLPISKQIKERDLIIDKLLEEDNLSVISVKYWKIDKYQIIRVFRDKLWFQSVLPELKTFWNKIEHYREVGIDKLEEKPKTIRKRKTNCLFIEDSDDETIQSK